MEFSKQMNECIKLKLEPFPVTFSGTSVRLNEDRSLFPYPNHWRGDFRSALPMIYARRAGWVPRTISEPTIPVEDKFSIPSWCFETAPSTQFPCDRGLLYRKWL